MRSSRGRCAGIRRALLFFLRSFFGRGARRRVLRLEPRGRSEGKLFHFSSRRVEFEMGLQLLEESEKRALVGGLIAAEVSEQAFVLFRPVIGVRSRGLSGPALPSLTREPAPSLINRERMIERLKLYANAYVRTLPDFLCNEITDRYSNLRGVAASGSARYNKHMHHSDTLTAELAFAPRMQRDRLRLASNTESLRNKQGQSLSMGEFGQDMTTILASHADPELKWDCWRRRGGGLCVFCSAATIALQTIFLLFSGAGCRRYPAVVPSRHSGCNLC